MIAFSFVAFSSFLVVAPAAAGTEPQSLSVPAGEASPAMATPSAPQHAEGPIALGTVAPAELKPSFRLPEVVVTGEGEPIVPSRREVTLPGSVSRYLKAVAPAEQVTLVLPSLLSGQKGVPQLPATKGRKHVLEAFAGVSVYNPDEADTSRRFESLLSHQTERVAGARIGQVLPKFNYLLDLGTSWRDGWIEEQGVIVPATAGWPVPSGRMRAVSSHAKADIGAPIESDRELRGGIEWREDFFRLAHDPNPQAHLVKRRFGGGAAWQGQSTRLSGFSGSFRTDWTRLSGPPVPGGSWTAAAASGGTPTAGVGMPDGSLGLPHEVADHSNLLSLSWRYPTDRFYPTPFRGKDEVLFRIRVLYDAVSGLLPPPDALLPSVLPSGAGVIDRQTKAFLPNQSVLAVKGDLEEVLPGEGYEAAAGVRLGLATGFKSIGVVGPTLRGSVSLGRNATLFGSFEPDLAHQSLGELAFERDAVRAYHEAPAIHRSFAEKAGVMFRVGEVFRAEISGGREDRSGATAWDNPYLGGTAGPTFLFPNQAGFSEWRFAPRNVYRSWYRLHARLNAELTLAGRLTPFLRYQFTRSRFRDASDGARIPFEPENRVELGLRYEPGARQPWRFEGSVTYADPVYFTVEPTRRGDGSLERSIPDRTPAWGNVSWRLSRQIGDRGEISLSGEHFLYRRYHEYFPQSYGYHRPHLMLGLLGTLRL